MKCSLIFVAVACMTCLVSSAPMLPNIGYVGYGYNVFMGNPHATTQFDPGFGQAPIFQLDYTRGLTTPDGAWLIPDGVSVPGAVTTCSVDDTSTTIESGYTYQSTLTKDVKFHIGFFLASFTVSKDYTEIYKYTNSSKDVFVSTLASCQTYAVDINPFMHPNFTSVISSSAEQLPTVFSAANAAPFWEFFDFVGTHFPTQIVYGSRYGYIFHSTAVQWAKLQETKIDVTVAASIAAKLSVGINIESTSDKLLASNFTSQTLSTVEYSMGVPPPQDGQASTWLKVAATAPQMAPLQYTLSEISDLFTTDYTNDPALLARYGAVQAALGQYCQLHLLATGKLSSCAAPAQ